MEDIENTVGTRNDIFSIQLNSEGQYWLLRFCRIVKWVLLFGIVISIPVVITNVLQLLSKERAHTLTIVAYRPLIRLQIATYPYFSLVYISLWLIQIFFYWKFSRLLNNAVLNSNEQGFNESFRYLYINARVLLITILISFSSSILNFLVTIKYR